ncbi:DUF7507 domain-containing protein [Cellulomonas hominis]
MIEATPPVPPPATHPMRARAAALVLALVLTLLATSVGTAPARADAGGTLNSLAITTVYDGQVTNSLDDGPANGVVASNDVVGFRWDLNATDLVEGVFTQTLPPGWTWDTASLAPLSSNSSAYRSSYVLSDGGRTLTATISVGQGIGAPTVMASGTLRAVPSGDVANGSVYTPTLTGTDATGETTRTAAPITVVNEPRADLYKLRTDNNVPGQHDFGDGAGIVAARYVDFRLTVQDAVGTARVGARNIDIRQPMTIADAFSFSGASPAGGAHAEIVARSEAGASATLTQDGAGLSLVLDNFSAMPAAWVTVRLWIRDAEVPLVTGTALTLTNTAGPSGWTSTEGEAVVEDPANNTAVGVLTRPAGGTGPGGTGPGGSGIQNYKNLWLFRDQAGSPDLPGDPASQGTQFTDVTGRDVAIGSLVAARFWLRPNYELAGSTSTGATNLVGYDFWDPTEQQVTAGQIYVGRGGTQPVVPSADYTVQYTAGTDRTNPEQNTWVDSVAQAGGPGAASGIRIAYTAGVWAGGVPSTAASFVVAVPFRLVGAGGSKAVDYSRWTTAEGTAGYSAYVTVQNHLLRVLKSASVSSIVSGSPVAYTLRPSLSTAPGAPGPVTATGVTVVDTLPTGLVSVDTSAVDPAWRVAAEGEPGAGLVLTFTYQGTASSATPLPPIVYTVQTSVLAPATGTLVNLAEINADGNTQSRPARSATSVVSVHQAQVATEEKTVVGESQIEVGDPTVSWESHWYNFLSTSQGRSYFVDVLPWNGDGRGTDFHGTATFRSATLTGANAAGTTLEYTTDDRASVYAAPANGTAITWSSTPPDDLSTVTALRAVVTDLVSGPAGFGGLAVTMAVDGQRSGDRYVNDVNGWLGEAGVLEYSNEAVIDVLGSSVRGVAWHDVDRDGARQPTEALLADVEVALLDDAGALVAATTTATDGSYTFTELHSGTYRTVLTESTLGRAAHEVVTNTYDLDLTRDSDSGTFPVGKNVAVADVDFGYAFAASAIDLVKTGVLEGDAAVGATVRWTFTLTNTGETDLTDVSLVDHLPGVSEPVVTWPGADGELEVGAHATAEATYLLTEEDVARGSVPNTATVTGTNPAGHPVTDDAEADVGYEVPAPAPTGPTDPTPGEPAPVPSPSPSSTSEVLAAGAGDPGAGGGLARTGTDARGLAVVAAALFLLGVGSTGLATRHRRRA